MKIKEFIKNGILLARYVPASFWKDGLSFFSKDEEYVQVGTWNYPKGKELLAHVHNTAVRTVTRTQEVLYVRKGKLKAAIYTLKGKFVDTCVLTEGDVLILLSCGHGYTILEDGTEVLEVKNGPYLGADVDRKRI